MRIYWKRKPDVLKTLIKKYAGNKDVTHIGYMGWEILVNSGAIVKEIKRYCQYRNKNIIIDKIEEVEEEEEEIEETDEINELAEGTYVTDEWYDKLEEEDLIMEQQYQYPEFQCVCADDEDECDCEVNYIRQKMIEELILQGTYRNICYSRKRLEMQNMLDKYY